MNIKRIGLALLAVLMVGLLLMGSVGCGVPAEVQEELTQLRQERQEREAEKQQAAEEERIAQIVAKVVDQRFTALEAKLTEKEKEANLEKLEKELAEIKSQLTKFSSDLESLRTTQPGWRYYPSPPPYYWPPQPPPTPYPTAYFGAEVYRGKFDQYVGYFNESTIDHDWEYGGPYGLTQDFSVRWEGRINLDSSGRWEFKVIRDGWVRLWIDGTRRINQWNQGRGTHYAYLNLSSGEHTVKLEYYTSQTDGAVKLSWRLIDDDC